MKRCWFGLGLLIVLLLSGILVTRTMVRRHESLSARLEQAAAAAEAADWTAAEHHFREARKNWEQHWHFSAAFVDHEPMEEADGLFAQAEVFLLGRDPVGLAALCRQLARHTAAIGESHAPNWWNLL